MSRRTSAILSLTFVAFGFALLNVVARMMGEGLGPMTQVYLRIGFGLVLALFVFRKNIRVVQIKSLSKRDWWILFIMGTLAYSIAVYFVTMGALNTNLLNVSVVYSTIGFFVYVYSLIFLKNKFNPIVILLILLSFLGIVFIAGKSFMPRFGTFGIGELYVLISAALMGFTSIGRKLLSKSLNNYEIAIIVMAIGFISGLVIALIKGEALPSIAAFSVTVFIGLIIGGIFNITSNYFENYAFEHLDVVLGNQILLLESLFSVIIGVIFYRELITFPEIIGSALVLSSVYWSNKIL